MSTKKPIILISGQPTQYTPPTTSSGSGNAGDIPGLDSTGRLDTTFMPVGIGAETQIATASEALAAGDFVNIYDNSGTLSMRKAVGTDATKPADGFVLAAVSMSATGTAYVGSSLNTKGAVGSFTTADRGATVWLDASTGGAFTKTAPSGAGNLQQALGTIMDVGSFVTIQWDKTQGYVM